MNTVMLQRLLQRADQLVEVAGRDRVEPRRSARRERRSRGRARERGRAPRAWSCRPTARTGTCRRPAAVSPTISSLARAISSISLCEMARFSRMGNCTFWRTVSEENSAPCWNNTPQRRSSARRSCSLARSRSTPSTSIEPWRFGNRPMIVRSSTDLPAARAADHAEDLAPAHVEGEMVEHGLLAETDHEVAHLDDDLLRHGRSHPDRGEEHGEQPVEHDHEEDRFRPPRRWSAARAIRRCP